MPTLIVVGSEDEFTPLDDARLMHDRIAGSTLAVVVGAGHMPNLECPRHFDEVLQRSWVAGRSWTTVNRTDKAAQ